MVENLRGGESSPVPIEGLLPRRSVSSTDPWGGPEASRVWDLRTDTILYVRCLTL